MHRTPALCALLLAFVAGGCEQEKNTAPPAPPPAVAPPQATAWNGEGLERIGPGPSREAVRQHAWVDSLRVEEAQRLRPHAPAVQRSSGSRLVITAGNGMRRVFSDEQVGEEIQRLHLFRDYIEPLGQYLVEVILVPEGGQQLLVDARTGEVTEVDAPPVASPDGRRFLTASLDLVAGHQPNRIRIYRMEGGAPVLEWEVEPRDWGGTNPSWEDTRTIRLERAEVDWSTTPLGLRTAPLRLELREGGWRMSAAPPRAAAATAPVAEPRQALLDFFAALRERRYADAVELYGGSYEVLEGWNPYHDPTDRASLWRAACEGNGLECFRPLEIVREEEVAPGEHHLTVRFLTSTGVVWTMGPCCGATEEEMPPVSEFTFTVRRASEGFRVHTLPVYVP